MNESEFPVGVLRLAYRCVLRTRWLLRKQKCDAYGDQSERLRRRISRISVINLDRQEVRWRRTQEELRHVLDGSGTPLAAMTSRLSAVDARDCMEGIGTDLVEAAYSLGDHLFVDPQHQLLPRRLDLDERIDMSLQEIAVALSHIEAWKQIAAGHHEYTLVLEDDVWFRHRFARSVDQAWAELSDNLQSSPLFDILYLSYQEVDNGAEKTFVSPNVFRPFRGLWYLSGYVLSRGGAGKLLKALPVRGPVDLWLNHQFGRLRVLATAKSVIDQRIDQRSDNSYSVLPVLSKIGVLSSETPGRFRGRPQFRPVFAFGTAEAGLTSLAMALSMLGYRCCSDVDRLPMPEMEFLMHGSPSRVFNAYVLTSDAFNKLWLS